ncbi:MAG: zinc-finger domain-containing protein [Methylovirgula sp.]
MADHGTPHFHNQPGVARVRIGAKKFMCMGALPPFDHPHIFIDMGDADDAICPYCSTHYVHDASLAPGACEPAECAFPDAAAAA